MVYEYIEEEERMKKYRELKENNQGIAVVEIILILVILIALVIIFRNEIKEVVDNVLGEVTRKGEDLQKAVPTLSPK